MSSLRFVAVLLPAALFLGSATGCSDSDTETAAASSSTQASTGQGAGGMGGGGAGGMGGIGGTCTNTLPVDMTEPAMLSQTGLYTDIANKTLAPYVREFAPQFTLWSDGATKTRWVYLPECEQIDTTEMDDWDFPVGTRIWKQFERNGALLETRLIHRFGAGDGDWLHVAYQWDAFDTDGTPVPMGAMDTKGEGWSIPNHDGCLRCHGPFPAKGGWPSRYLGFSAIQLSHSNPGVTIQDLIDENKLSSPPSAPFTVPGNQIEHAALGYLHANCSNCHNSTTEGIAFPPMDMRLSVTDTTVMGTAAYTDLVNQPMLLFIGMGCTYRLAGMDIADSCVHLRMNTRGNSDQMPPIGTAIVDTTGLTAIEAWIGILP